MVSDSGPPAYVAANDSDTLETLLLRAKGDPMALVPELRKTIASIDPDVAIGTIRTYDDMVGDNFSSRKLECSNGERVFRRRAVPVGDRAVRDTGLFR